METVIERNNVLVTEAASPSALSAVSWAAVFAGAVTAAALSLIMFILGIGLGLGAVSPWYGEGISGTALGVSTILWITLTSLVASAAGGYIAGRLRTRWLGVHTDEVFFRDTAHGFLAWGLATLLTAVIFTTATAGIAKTGVQAGAAVVGGVAETAANAGIAGAASSGDDADAASPRDNAVSYYLDSLFRTGVMNQVQVNALQVTPATPGNAQPAQANNQQAANTTQQQGTPEQQEAAAAIASTEEGAQNLTPAQQAAIAAGGASPETMVQPNQGARRALPTQQGAPASLPEVERIFTRSLMRDELTRDDATYVGRLVAQHTGMSEMEAEARVNDVFARTQAELRQMETAAREAADEARAASMKTALWFFVALLGGAFLGSFSATIGGRQRDF
jgi:hypothetical protein